ncbi:non-contractile tail fiber protein [Klebsiella virus 2019KP1]|nr:non-contractile tail fiber protein [Klebsiella virus 2019KP1]
MAFSWQESVPPSGTQNIQCDIEYLDKSYIHVYLDGEETTAFSWSSDTVIRLNTALTADTVVLLTRKTEREYLYIMFASGAPFIEVNVDTQNKQFLHLAQELVEGRAIAGFYGDSKLHGYRITNVGDPEEARDAANKRYVDADNQETLRLYFRSPAALPTFCKTYLQTRTGWVGIYKKRPAILWQPRLKLIQLPLPLVHRTSQSGNLHHMLYINQMKRTLIPGIGHQQYRLHSIISELTSLRPLMGIPVTPPRVCNSLLGTTLEKQSQATVQLLVVPWSKIFLGRLLVHCRTYPAWILSPTRRLTMPTLLNLGMRPKLPVTMPKLELSVMFEGSIRKFIVCGWAFDKRIEGPYATGFKQASNVSEPATAFEIQKHVSDNCNNKVIIRPQFETTNTKNYKAFRIIGNSTLSTHHDIHIYSGHFESHQWGVRLISVQADSSNRPAATRLSFNGKTLLENGATGDTTPAASTNLVVLERAHSCAFNSCNISTTNTTTDAYNSATHKSLIKYSGSQMRLVLDSCYFATAFARVAGASNNRNLLSVVDTTEHDSGRYAVSVREKPTTKGARKNSGNRAWVIHKRSVKKRTGIGRTTLSNYIKEGQINGKVQSW